MNVHVDVANDPHSKQLSTVLETFGHTHKQGQTLDSRGVS